MVNVAVSLSWQTALRISVRGLIVLILLVAAALGWLVQSARIQREAVAVIERTGGTVSYSWARRDGNAISGGEPMAPRWLMDLIGLDYFDHVTAVQLYGPATAADAALAQVGRLTRIQELSGRLATASDAGLAHLKGLTDLSSLILRDTQITDAGLEHLSGLTSLTFLDLRGNKVTDAGLAHLKGLTNLRWLDLSSTKVTGAELFHLKDLAKLNYLILRDTQLDDARAQELKRHLPRLAIFH
jgi:internalin A